MRGGVLCGPGVGGPWLGRWAYCPLSFCRSHRAAASVLSCWFSLELGTWFSLGHVALGHLCSVGLLGVLVIWILDTSTMFMICITALVMDDPFVKIQLFVKRLD